MTETDTHNDPNTLFAHAVKHHEQGELAEADALFRAVLKIQPHHAQAWNGLGIIAQKIGMFDVSAELLTRATEIEPDNALYFFNLGNIYHSSGDLNREIIAYTQAIALDPNHYESYANLAYSLHEQNCYANAATLYKRALELRPDDAETRYNLANALVELGHCADAVAQFETLLHTHSAVAEIHFGLGRALQKLGRDDAAIAAYQHAAKLNPNMAEAHRNLGTILRGQGNLDSAVAHYVRALALDRTVTGVQVALGASLRELGRTQEALRVLSDACLSDPNDPLAHANLGTALADNGRFGDAIRAHERALALSSTVPEMYMNYGIALQCQRRVDDAISAYLKALELNPNLGEANWNLALALLLKGNFEQGWAEYESRWQGGPLRHAKRQFTQAQWRGEDIADKTLLLHAEQGFGDTLQFIRYVPLVAQRGARIIVECQAELESLLRFSFPGVRVVARGVALPSFDLHCPLLSLPLAFATRQATIPAKVPYLNAPPAQQTYWHARIEKSEQKQVGIVWAGSPREQDPAARLVDQRRSMRLSDFAALAAVPNMTLHSLQKGQRAFDVTDDDIDFEIIDYNDALNNFTDTAALILQLDLVICVDTAVAHLAGALGKPVWLLSRFDGCWRWGIDSANSPWYPSLRIFRQSRPGDWEGVINDVRLALETT